MQDILGPLHGGFGPGAARLLFRHAAVQAFDDGNQRLVGMEFEKLPIKSIDMVEAVVVADGRRDSGDRINQRLGFRPADNRAHKSVGIDRGKISPRAYQRNQMIIQFFFGRPVHFQRGNVFYCADAVFPVNNLFSDFVHKTSLHIRAHTKPTSRKPLT